VPFFIGIFANAQEKQSFLALLLAFVATTVTHLAAEIQPDSATCKHFP